MTLVTSLVGVLTFLNDLFCSLYEVHHQCEPMKYAT